MADTTRIDAKTYQSLRSRHPEVSDKEFDSALDHAGFAPEEQPAPNGQAEWATQNPGTNAINKTSDFFRGPFMGALSAADALVEKVPTAYDTFSSDPNITPLQRWAGAVNAPATGLETVAKLARLATKGYGEASNLAEQQMLSPEPALGISRNAYEQLYNAANLGKAVSETTLPTTKLSAALLALGGKNPKGAPNSAMGLSNLGPESKVAAPMSGELGISPYTPAERTGSPTLAALEKWITGKTERGAQIQLEKTQANNLAVQEDMAQKANKVFTRGQEEATGTLMSAQNEAEQVATAEKAQHDLYVATEKTRERTNLLEGQRTLGDMADTEARQKAVSGEATALKKDYEALPTEYKQGPGQKDATAASRGLAVQYETFGNTRTALRKRTKDAWDAVENNPVMPASYHTVDPELVDDISKMADAIEARGRHDGGKFVTPAADDKQAYEAIKAILNGNGTFASVRSEARNLPKGTALESRLTSTFAQKAANSGIPEVEQLGKDYLSAVGLNQQETALTESLKNVISSKGSEKALQNVMGGRAVKDLATVMTTDAVPEATKNSIRSSSISNLSDAMDDAVRLGKDPVQALNSARVKMGPNFDTLHNAEGAKFLESHAKNLKAAKDFAEKYPSLAAEGDKLSIEIQKTVEDAHIRLSKLNEQTAFRNASRAKASESARTQIDTANQNGLRDAEKIRRETAASVQNLIDKSSKEKPVNLVHLSTREGEKGKRIYGPRRGPEEKAIAAKDIATGTGLIVYAAKGAKAAANVLGIYAGIKLLGRIPNLLATAYYSPSLAGAVTLPARMGSQGVANMAYLSLKSDQIGNTTKQAKPEPKRRTGWEALYKK